MNTFSFRAECQADVDALKQVLKEAALTPSVVGKPTVNGMGPDLVVQIDADISLAALQDLVRKIPDGHVILQTLRQCPLAQNSLERDYGLN